MTRREGEREEEGRCAGWVWKAGLAAGVGRSLIKEGGPKGGDRGLQEKTLQEPLKAPKRVPRAPKFAL